MNGRPEATAVTPGDAAVAPRASRREWIGLAVIALPCVLYSMDLTVLNLAVPSLSAQLRPSAAELLWIVDVYGFLVAGSLITMGTLGDRIGRRRLLLIGAAAFGVASVVAAFSTTPRMLIVTRALLGLAGATLAPSTLSLIRNMFLDPRERTTAIGIWVSSYSVGAAIGPLVGGVLLEYFWWGSVFLVSVPVMVLLLAAGPSLLPEYRDPHAGRLDIASAALSLAAVLPTIYGLKQMAEHGLAWQPAAAMTAGVVMGAVFVVRQRRLANPMIDLDLFRAPAFGVALLTYTIATFVAFGAFVFIAQYLQVVMGLSPLEAGLWTAPFALAFIVGSTLTPHVLEHVRAAYVMASGLALAVVGFGLLTQVHGPGGFGLAVTGFVIYSLGLAPVFTLAIDMIVSSAPPERAGAAAAISETGSELGGALGIAVLGSIGTAVYRSRMAEVPAAGVPPAAAESARATLGAARSVAEQFPETGRSLFATAQSAFTESLQLAALISAVVVAMTAIAAVVALRRVRTTPEH